MNRNRCHSHGPRCAACGGGPVRQGPGGVWACEACVHELRGWLEAKLAEVGALDELNEL